KEIYEMHKGKDHAHLFTRIPKNYTIKEAKKFVRGNIKNFGNKEYGFIITDKKTKRILGSCIIWIFEKDNKGNLGYYIRNDARNKGYVTEAARALLDFGFGKLKLNRININHVKGNKASQRVIKKLGAKYEGLEREAILSGSGKYQDHLTYAILAKEWKPKNLRSSR
ncbi:MAG: GNAT family N-acetyltransferase, partial [Nanoarchaeota archaeon]|nr:GNAT family N-acetyltransferase [Nanoarchaeota archaeon]